MQALSNGYFLLFFPVLVVAWLAWFVDWRRAPGRGLAIITAWAVASLPLLPVLLKYREVHERLGLTRTVAEIRDFSAVPASFLHAAPLMSFWREGPAHNYEQYLFTGVTVVLLACRRSRPAARCGHARAVVAGRAPIVFYARGHGPDVGAGARARRRRTGSGVALSSIQPGCSGCPVSTACACQRASRWSARLCLAMAASLAVAHWSSLSLFAGDGSSWSRRARGLAGVAVIAGLLADGMTRRGPGRPASGKVILPGSQQAAVIELPLDNTDVSIEAMYRSIFHRQPLVNGYSGHFPPTTGSLSLSLWRGDVSGLFYLARRRPLVIIVNHRFDHGPQLQADDRGSARHPVATARAAPDRCFFCRRSRRRASRRSSRHSRQPCATPAATCSSSTSVQPHRLSAIVIPAPAALRRLAPRDHGSRRPRMGRPGRNRGSDGPAAWPSKPRSPIRAGADSDSSSRRQGALRARVSGLGVDEDGERAGVTHADAEAEC